MVPLSRKEAKNAFLGVAGAAMLTLAPISAKAQDVQVPDYCAAQEEIEFGGQMMAYDKTDPGMQQLWEDQCLIKDADWCVQGQYMSTDGLVNFDVYTDNREELIKEQCPASADTILAGLENEITITELAAPETGQVGVHYLPFPMTPISVDSVTGGTMAGMLNHIDFDKDGAPDSVYVINGENGCNTYGSFSGNLSGDVMTFSNDDLRHELFVSAKFYQGDVKDNPSNSKGYLWAGNGGGEQLMKFVADSNPCANTTKLRTEPQWAQAIDAIANRAARADFMNEHLWVNTETGTYGVANDDVKAGVYGNVFAEDKTPLEWAITFGGLAIVETFRKDFLPSKNPGNALYVDRGAGINGIAMDILNAKRSGLTRDDIVSNVIMTGYKNQEKVYRDLFDAGLENPEGFE